MEAVKVVESAVVSLPEPVQSAEWSEESGSDDDLLLKDIITLGMPTSRQQAPVKQKAVAPTASVHATSSSFRPVPKSASAQSLGQNHHGDFPLPGTSVPPSQSTDSSLFKGYEAGATRHSESDDDDDDDEMLYACIKAAKPTVKPVSVAKSSNPNSKPSIPHTSVVLPVPANAQRGRQPRPPMELPKPPATKEVREL